MTSLFFVVEFGSTALSEFEKGKPVVRLGRKAMGLQTREIARLPDLTENIKQDIVLRKARRSASVSMFHVSLDRCVEVVSARHNV